MVSKTKVAAVLIGASAVIGTVASAILGNISILTALLSLVTEVGGVLLAFGIRDWPIINTPIQVPVTPTP